ncbi:outer membrane beta-barrel protein [Hyphococcus luteus]|uniref:Porin family protein n=1 Tax=Hyphococcus luteus TaxID=2058213 RepID=A0A2S7JZ51_9PROT|nr:outer membrane beta-barrel protein [Marinicaulis flavus]PQA85533.1 porin family protein [Marinicaulis flavus]
MRKKKTILFLSAASLCAAGAAQAQGYGAGEESVGPYLSAGYNYMDFDEKVGGDADISAITARGGWQFARFFAIESDISFGVDDGGFDFNRNEDDLDFDDNNDDDFNDVIAGPGDLGLDYLVGGYGRFIFPVSDKVDLSARAGYAFAEIDSTVQTLGGNQLVFGGSDDGFAFGGSAAYDITENLSLRADYTHYDFSDSNAESFGLNLEVKFGG